MVFNSGSTSITGSVSVTVSGTLPKNSATQTLVNAGCRGAAAAATTLYTVPAGKTFYCLGVVMSSSVACEMYVLDDATEVTVANLQANGTVSYTGGVIFAAAENSVIAVTSNSTGKGCRIWGYIE